MKKAVLLCLLFIFTFFAFCEDSTADNEPQYILSFSEDKYNQSQIVSPQYFLNFLHMNIPDEKFARCAEYKPEIIEEIKAIGAVKLSDDAIFLKILKTELNNPERTIEDKVYYFYEMLDSFYWAFCGVTKNIPISHHYAEEMIFRGSTFASYRENLKNENFDSAPYFELFYKYKEQKPILSSYSLLLGSLLEKNDIILSETLEKIANEEIYKTSSMFASFIFHDVSIISFLITFSSFNYDATDILIKLFNDAQKEEEKEDLIIALCLAKNENRIENGFKTILTVKNSAQSSVIKSFFKSAQLIHKQGISKNKEKKEFKKLVNLYLANATENWQKDLAKSIINCDYQFGYAVPTQAEANKMATNEKTKSLDKIWDDFSMEMYSNGSFVVYGTYVQFIPIYKN